MVVDVRHDHSFRIPRPDLSVSLGTPNACNDCHHDKDASWAKAAVEQWFGAKREGFQTYAPAFHAAWVDGADAQALLTEAAKPDASPAVARASALAALDAYPNPQTVQTAQKALADPDPMVRVGALDALEGVRGPELIPVVAPKLSDPVLAVRLRAVSLLAGVPDASLPAEDRDAWTRAVADFEAAQRLNADRPEARATLAGFYVQRGRLAEAEPEYLAALKLDPHFSPAAIGLAEIYRQRGEGPKAIDLLKTAAAAGGDGGVHHALGLELVRAKRYDEALAELKRAVELAPGDSRFVYVYAVALNSMGQGPTARAEIDRALKVHPADRNLLAAAFAFGRDAGDVDAMLSYGERLLAVTPDDANLANLVRTLKQKLKR